MILTIFAIIKHPKEVIIIAGPVGKSKVIADVIPPNTEMQPIIAAYTIICKGVRLTLKAAAAGIMSIAVTKSTPIILKEMAMNNAKIIVKLNFINWLFTPSACSNSSLILNKISLDQL